MTVCNRLHYIVDKTSDMSDSEGIQPML